MVVIISVVVDQIAEVAPCFKTSNLSWRERNNYGARRQIWNKSLFLDKLYIYKVKTTLKRPLMLQTDYLIIGCGAVGMAFADTLLSESDANIIIVDRYAKPGGHWTVAYPFVTLHQPSNFYGVNSKELSKGHKDEVGLNQGLFSLASGAEILGYYDDIMRHTFLPSGRVQYFPLCEYKGNHTFESLITGEHFSVKVNKKLVDTTILKTSVPATHEPNFSVAEGVSFIPINDLPKVSTPPAGFVVIGGGKTGMDACLWLLENQVNPDHITWIVSRDAWLLDRQNSQPTEAFFEYSFGSIAHQNEAITNADSVSDLFDRLEQVGVLARIDQTIRPTMFHGATVSQLELEQLRRIKKVVRLGKVKHIGKDKIILENGTIPTTENHIHIDCSASAVTNFEIKPVFQEGLITPQTVRSFQPVFSASVIAYIEAKYDDDQTKNKLCQIVPLPNHDTDWVAMTMAQMANQFAWSKEKELKNWLRSNRLNGIGNLMNTIDREEEKNGAILARIKKSSLPAMIKLQQFMTELSAEKQSKIENPQLQVKKDLFFMNRLAEIPQSSLAIGDGEILVRIEKFAYSANNITYAVAGDMIGYWQFFPPVGEQTNGWGVIPVWGFARVVESKVDEIPVGDRFFGYFPPARYLKMKPAKIAPTRFMDASDHRRQLPSGYNSYRRVNNEPHYNPAFDRELMLLFPLHLTSFCLWDALKEMNWYGAEQVIILSASSKTSTGLGYALQADPAAPKMIGMTSAHNLENVKKLNLYDQSLSYEMIEAIDASIPTVIVDMSGNVELKVALHQHLGNNMKFTSNVGFTHWADLKPKEGIIEERSQFFFAPEHISKRIKEWGGKGFNEKTTAFIMQTAAKMRTWLKFRQINGLHELAAIHPQVCEGAIPSNEGLIVVVS